MFPILFSSVKIGSILIKNRLAMAPMNLLPPSSLCDSKGRLTKRAIDFYVERAMGGVGAIITSVFKVENKIEPLTLGDSVLWPIFRSDNLSIWGELIDLVHAFDTKIFIQFSAGAGRVIYGNLIDAGFIPVSASAVPAFWRPTVTCRPLSVNEIEQIVEAFAHAAEMAATIGIDGIEIHGHEGYLIDQFMTALWNKRTDEYGGDLDGRLRFPIEIIKAIKNVTGKNYPIIFRFSVKHLIDDGFGGEKGRDINESIEIAKKLERAGVDALDLDAGCYESLYWAHPPVYQPHGCTIEFVAKIKKVVNVPIIVAGKLDEPDLATRVIQEGKADVISLGRALLADPYWPKKVLEGKIEDIRPCIGCHEGCLYRPRSQCRHLSCAVNPLCGREKLFRISKTRNPKKILIVGGGPAGMEAARVAALRGHRIILCEKTSMLGGHLIEAGAPNFKQDVKKLLSWYLRQLNRLPVEIRYNTEVDVNYIEKEEPDIVVVATGSSPLIPLTNYVKGGPKIVSCCDLLSGKENVGNSVVIVGGGLEGCETALWLAGQGKKVTIVEIESEILWKDIHAANRQMLIKLLSSAGVAILTKTTIREIKPNCVVVETKSPYGEKVIYCDTIAFAVGMKPNDMLYHILLDKGKYKVYMIGDCKKPRKILDSILEGFIVGCHI
jgi:2-enoate reductase